MHEEREYAPRALRAGASGYVMKQEAAEVLLLAVRVVLGGQIALSVAMRERLITGVVRGARADSPAPMTFRTASWRSCNCSARAAPRRRWRKC